MTAPRNFGDPPGPGLETRMARAICRIDCAFRGEPPCYEIDPADWPPATCCEPGCAAYAAEAAAVIIEPDSDGIALAMCRAINREGERTMRLTAKVVPYSSIVVGGLMLQDEGGRAVFQVAFLGTTSGIIKAETEALAEAFAWWVNELGLEVPDRPTVEHEGE